MPRTQLDLGSEVSDIPDMCSSDDSDVSDEFAMWWDREHVQRTYVACPHSPGMFPPLVAQTLSAAYPHLARVVINPPTKEEVWGAMEPLTLPLLPPDDEDWYMARPHPDALYVFETNSWAVVSVRQKEALPSSVRVRSKTEETFLQSCSHRGHDSDVATCVYTPAGLSERNPHGTEGRPHHFHLFLGAVPFSTSHADPAHVNDRRIPQWEIARLPESLDLYVCCTCSTHVLVSQNEHIPGIVPVELLDNLRVERAASPKGKMGESPEERIVRAIGAIIAIVQNVLWRGVTLDIKNNTPHFEERLGHTPTVAKIFESLQFTWGPDLLRPPQFRLSSKSERTREIKTLLLRAWVELYAWLSEYRIKYGSRVRRAPLAPFVVTQDAIPLVETALGASPSQIPRSKPPGSALVEADDCWLALGLTQDTFSPDIVRLAYLAQLRCDPHRTPIYYNHLKTLFAIAYNEEYPAYTQSLQRFMYREGAKHRWDAKDLRDSLRALGFNVPKDHQQPKDFEDLHISIDPQSCTSKVHEALFERAFKHAMCRAENARVPGTNPDDAEMDIATISVRRAELRGALNTVAEHLGSYKLKELSSREAHWQPMSVRAAYGLLNVPSDANDEAIVSAFENYVGSANDLDHTREALEIISHARESAPLEKYLATGVFNFRKPTCRSRRAPSKQSRKGYEKVV